MPSADPLSIADAVDDVFGRAVTVVVDEQRLTAVMRLLLADAGAGAVGEDALELVIGSFDERPPFGYRVGRWSADVRRSTVQSAVAAAVLALGARAAGINSLPVAVLAVILPFIVDIDRVEVRASDREVVAALRRASPIRGTANDWYDVLPTDVAQQITRLEFLDVLERLSAAGLVKVDPVGIHEFEDAPYGTLALPLP